MGKHDIQDNAEDQWPGENLLAKNDAEEPHDGKHRREDTGDDAS